MNVRLLLGIASGVSGLLFTQAAQAQTRVLVLGDGSTMFSAISYYNAAISEFGTVVGAANVQARNDLDTVSLTAAMLRRPDGNAYDIIVVVASFNGIGTNNWSLLREAVRTRTARSFVLFSDYCSLCNRDNVDGGNGNGFVPLLNAAGGWTTSTGILRTSPLGVPLNTNTPLSSSFVGLNPMQTNDYRSINGVPANNALYLAPGASVPPMGTTRIDDVAAVLLPSSQSYGGLGACVFAIADVNPLAIPGNPGRVGPAFVNAITSTTGSCALGPLVITGPANGSTTSNPRPMITGVAQPGATITVVVSGQTLTTTAAPDGSWSLTPTTALTEGSHTATATRTLGGVTQTASTTFSVIVCGNGAIAGDERCDDGNTTDGDGCSATCTIERGYLCRGDRSVCRITCGDGVRAASEACDDGNTMASDGCSSTCTIETGYTCDNPDVTVFYSHRGVADCVEVPAFEPASSATVPARLTVPGVGVWRSYRARYVAGVVDFSDRPTSFRSPTLLQFDPGTGVRAAVFGGFTRIGQTSPSLARMVAEGVFYDFAVGVAGSVRGATPDIPEACSNNSDTTITYRIDSMSVCAPPCRDTSPTATDTGCTVDAPHCLAIAGGGARCEACIDSTMTGTDLGCTSAARLCVADTMGRNRCVACTSAADCDDGNPCTTDTCSASNACVQTPVAAGATGACASGRVCSGGEVSTCVACVTNAQCSGATPVCNATTRSCVGCLVDSDCNTSMQYCETPAMRCVPRVPNGMPVPTVAGHTPPLTGMCTEAAAMAACVSRVCSSADNLCGYNTGEGPCSTENAAVVCRSGACGGDGRCRPSTGCNVDGDCAVTQFCDTAQRMCVPRLPNGTAIPTIAGHAPPLEGMCNMAVAMSVCLSAVCEVSDHRCGLTLNSPCTQRTQCRSGICAPNERCGECDATTPCPAGRVCDVATGTCRMPMIDAGPDVLDASVDVLPAVDVVDVGTDLGLMDAAIPRADAAYLGGGCGCTTPGTPRTRSSFALWIAALVFVGASRRSRRRTS